MEYEFLDEKNWKKEPFKLKDGVDLSTVDWDEEIRQMINLNDRLSATIDKWTKIFESQPPRPEGRGLQQPSPFKVSPNQLKRLAWVTSNGEWLDKTT
jgi:hypothetical protein